MQPEAPQKDTGNARREAPETPMFRLGERDNWLSMAHVQAVLDLMNERHKPLLSALLGEALTGEIPRRRV